MFDTRLRTVLILFVACWLVVLLRLFQLQVVRGEYYSALAESRVTTPMQPLEPVRGRICDRHGKPLATDEPSWSIALHYKLLVPEDRYLRRLGRQVINGSSAIAMGEPAPDPLALAAARLNDLWRDLARMSASSTQELDSRRQAILKRVRRWKLAYLRRRDIALKQATADDEIAEEQECHPIVEELTNAQQIDAQLFLAAEYPEFVACGAVKIENSSIRRYHDAECIAHVLGGLGSVSESDVDQRPYRDGERIVDLGGYKHSDMHGVRGVEWLAESRLRGKRGTVTSYLDQRPEQRIEPQDGKDVYLTIDYELQAKIYEILEQHVQSNALVPGGSVVVLDVDTREVLALVSYPSFDPNRWNELYSDLSRDTLRLPHFFRAISGMYQPGSIIKPLTVVAAHAAGLIDEHTTFECRGALFPDRPAGSRHQCWVWPNAHGYLNMEEAIKKSCNVFCFKVGQELGVQRLCDWLQMVGVGEETGIGLRAEPKPTGILPTPAYLAENRREPVSLGDAWNYSIGQGELLVTPLQAANLMATYASGRFQKARLLKHQPPQPMWRLPVEDAVWHIVRRGMYAGVNDPYGTSRAARLECPDYVLCGKSGSAETSLRVISYRVTYEDAEGTTRYELVPANFRRQAVERFLHDHPDLNRDQLFNVVAAEKWPKTAAEKGRHTHAWFTGFIQRTNDASHPQWEHTPRIALAVLLEFGGSGGRTAGPACRDVARLIVTEFKDLVEPRNQLAEGPP